MFKVWVGGREGKKFVCDNWVRIGVGEVSILVFCVFDGVVSVKVR